MTTTLHGTPYRPADQEGATMPAHDSLTSPELAAADTALLAIAKSVRTANEALAAARAAITEMEIALAELNGRCGCGCS